MPLGRRRLLAALGGLGLLAACGTDTPPATPLPPLTLPADAPLVSLGGLLLNRGVMGFGGLSGLHVEPDLGLTAVSDNGRWLRARLVLDEAGQPEGLAELRSGRLSDGRIFSLPAKLSRDAESLARTPEGTWLVGFERWHHIRAYDGDIAGWGRMVQGPPGLGRAPLNAGLESLTVLADGRWLAITEGFEESGGDLLRGWIGHPGAWTPISYRPTPGFLPTDLAALPDGGALLTERRFSLLGGFQGQLLRLPAAALARPSPGTILAGEVLLDAAALPAENWEGVTSFPWRGRQLVALIADDNEFFLQQGMLLLFAFR
ncbi:esterase-like activity of phytase family protein [Roseomonas marmotae]|uniref:esterase-like activity of phytase family protein n=1 Tax=Roseomonas marmotae TaxID=2768161 RepID=UPI001AD64138|nr:esterase-like activity of phytase family protein [Roseomonas marmotae]QTI80537.1 esterase-like activity of phytase family protein [Roseomonas marmotae]